MRKVILLLWMLILPLQVFSQDNCNFGRLGDGLEVRVHTAGRRVQQELLLYSGGECRRDLLPA